MLSPAQLCEEGTKRLLKAGGQCASAWSVLHLLCCLEEAAHQLRAREDSGACPSAPLP